MNCHEVQPLLIDYADNLLDAETRSAVEKHLAECEACAGEWKEISALFRDIEQVPLVMPSPALRESFHTMLQTERRRLETSNYLEEQPAGGKIRILHWSSPLWKGVAACLILAAGIWIGTQISKKPEENNLARLETEVKGLRETLMISMLDNESASERLKAVNYAEELTDPNQKVIGALINTLNNDKNVNVRLAALYSLAKFANSQTVRDSLVTSLSRQTEPIIQVVLINLLAEKKETKAIEPIRKILSNEKTFKEVKEAAQKGLKSI